MSTINIYMENIILRNYDWNNEVAPKDFNEPQEEKSQDLSQGLPRWVTQTVDMVYQNILTASSQETETMFFRHDYQ